MELRDAAAMGLACLDLTNLNDDCTEEDVFALCERALTPHGNTAAVCIWPQFVKAAASKLRTTGVRVATVVNFPSGMEAIEGVIDMTRQAVADGADEIDLVVPYPLLMEGQTHQITAATARVKEAAGQARVKTILETGVLGEAELIRAAAEEALEGGADFLKTSTGKVSVNATLQAARILLEAIRDSGDPVGLKPAGGIRTTEDAAAYLDLCAEIMGEDWVSPTTFRIGASGVLSAFLATLDGDAAPTVGSGY